jgi:hypothetical protein
MSFLFFIKKLTIEISKVTKIRMNYALQNFCPFCGTYELLNRIYIFHTFSLHFYFQLP